MFEIVDGRRTDAGVTGILSLEGSGELKSGPLSPGSLT